MLKVVSSAFALTCTLVASGYAMAIHDSNSEFESDIFVHTIEFCESYETDEECFRDNDEDGYPDNGDNPDDPREEYPENPDEGGPLF